MRYEPLPLVTPLTLVYNTGRYVIEALESVRANNYPNLQHIIIDDASKDDSVEIVKEWINKNEYPCIFIKHLENKGICKSLNEALELAKGRYVFGISDDLINNNYIRTSVEILEEAGEDYCLSFCDSNIINENGTDLGYDHHEVFRSLPSEYAFEDILKSNFINGIGALYRRRCLEEVGRYDETLYFEDWDIHIRLLKKYKVKKIDQKLTSYRQREESISSIKNCKYFESLLLICFKTIRITKINKKAIKRSIADYTAQYFMANGSSGTIYRRSFLSAVSVKTFIFWMLDFVGFSPKFYNRLKKLRSLKD